MKKLLLCSLIMPSTLLSDVEINRTASKDTPCCVNIKVTKEPTNDSNITLNVQITGSNDRDIAELTDVLSTWLSSHQQPTGYFSRQQFITAMTAGCVTAAMVVAAQMWLNSR